MNRFAKLKGLIRRVELVACLALCAVICAGLAYAGAHEPDPPGAAALWAGAAILFLCGAAILVGDLRLPKRY